jgi:hypothetical protein
LTPKGTQRKDPHRKGGGSSSAAGAGGEGGHSSAKKKARSKKRRKAKAKAKRRELKKESEALTVFERLALVEKEREKRQAAQAANQTSAAGGGGGAPPTKSAAGKSERPPEKKPNLTQEEFLQFLSYMKLAEDEDGKPLFTEIPVSKQDWRLVVGLGRNLKKPLPKEEVKASKAWKKKYHEAAQAAYRGSSVPRRPNNACIRAMLGAPGAGPFCTVQESRDWVSVARSAGRRKAKSGFEPVFRGAQPSATDQMEQGGGGDPDSDNCLDGSYLICKVLEAVDKDHLDSIRKELIKMRNGKNASHVGLKWEWVGGEVLERINHWIHSVECKSQGDDPWPAEQAHCYLSLATDWGSKMSEHELKPAEVAMCLQRQDHGTYGRLRRMAPPTDAGAPAVAVDEDEEREKARAARKADAAILSRKAKLAAVRNSPAKLPSYVRQPNPQPVPPGDSHGEASAAAADPPAPPDGQDHESDPDEYYSDDSSGSDSSSQGSTTVESS